MAREFALKSHSGTKVQTRSPDELIAEIARSQHGVIALRQMLRIGLGRDATKLRLRNGRLHPLHRGVYAVGHRVVSASGHRMAAVLAAGDDGALTHDDAAAEWAMLQKTGGLVHVTTPRILRSRPGLLLHRRRLPADEVTVLDGIPITTVPRTIFDLAATAPRRRVERALHEAEVQRLTDKLSLPDLLARYPGARGSALIRALLADHSVADSITKEGIVDLFFDFLDECDLPRPLTDHWISANGSSYECDCAFLEPRVIVELDGYATHSTRRKFESDRIRDRDLHLAGWLPVRVTWHQLRHDRRALAADLARLLARQVAA